MNQNIKTLSDFILDLKIKHSEAVDKYGEDVRVIIEVLPRAALTDSMKKTGESALKMIRNLRIRLARDSKKLDSALQRPLEVFDDERIMKDRRLLARVQMLMEKSNIQDFKIIENNFIDHQYCDVKVGNVMVMNEDYFQKIGHLEVMFQSAQNENKIMKDRIDNLQNENVSLNEKIKSLIKSFRSEGSDEDEKTRMLNTMRKRLWEESRKLTEFVSRHNTHFNTVHQSLQFKDFKNNFKGIHIPTDILEFYYNVFKEIPSDDIEDPFGILGKAVSLCISTLSSSTAESVLIAQDLLDMMNTGIHRKMMFDIKMTKMKMRLEMT